MSDAEKTALAAYLLTERIAIFFDDAKREPTLNEIKEIREKIEQHETHR